jgi:hypothetical protein
MPEKHGFPYCTVQFTKAGEVYDPGEAAAVLKMTATPGITDLLVLCHGWNDTMAEAEVLYDNLLGLLRAALTAGQVAQVGDRSFAALGVLWPSKKFADKELIAVHGAGLGSVVSDAVLLEQLEQLRAVLDDPAADAAIGQARNLVPLLEDKQTARSDFADLLRQTLPRGAAEEEDASTDLFALPGDEVMRRLSKPVLQAPGRPRQARARRLTLATRRGTRPASSEAFSPAGRRARRST